MKKYKGGRGHKAPYESVTMRVPIELKPVVSELVKNYRDNLTIENKSRGAELSVKIKEIQNLIKKEAPGFKMKSAGRLIKLLESINLD